MSKGKQDDALARALEGVGGLSRTFKMPCVSYGLPAESCVTGGRMLAVKGSVCSQCYARKGRYMFGPILAAQRRRLSRLVDGNWVDDMVVCIDKERTRWFRWHDSGDLQGIWHFEKICQVARRLPHVSFWLPTQEGGMVMGAMETGKVQVPDNVTIRLSAPMMDLGTPAAIKDRAAPLGVAHSVVFSSPAPFTYSCPATWTEDKKCGGCRACWDKTINTICYKRH
jgi:hypothetical protein